MISHIHNYNRICLHSFLLVLYVAMKSSGLDISLDKSMYHIRPTPGAFTRHPHREFLRPGQFPVQRPMHSKVGILPVTFLTVKKSSDFFFIPHTVFSCHRLSGTQYSTMLDFCGDFAQVYSNRK